MTCPRILIDVQADFAKRDEKGQSALHKVKNIKLEKEV
jgi:hypothetical protein